MVGKQQLRSVRSQDKDAFNTIIEDYYDDIYRFCLYMTGHEADSYDITQDVFLRFIRYAGSGRYKNLKGYLITIARNLCMDYFTHRKEDAAKSEMMSQVLKEGPQMTEVENKLFLLKLLDHLSCEQKEVVILRIYEDMKFKDIAEMTGINVSTIKSRYQMGIANMKRYMEEGGYG